MIDLLLKIALLAALTHGLRALSQVAGPRRGSLLLGLPSTTAVALLGCGQASGVTSAAEMAEACLAGLVASALLPVAFAQSLSLGRQLPRSITTSVLAYLLVAWISLFLPQLGPLWRIGLATLLILTVCRHAARIPIRESHSPPRTPSKVRCAILRTVVPALCLLVITLLRVVGGVQWAGLFSTFPGMTLAVLIVTYLESSPAEAGRIARELPTANLGMLAFVGTFRLGCPALGLGWSLAAGYLLALVTLGLIGTLAYRQKRTAPAERPTQSVIWTTGSAHSLNLSPAAGRSSTRHRSRVSGTQRQRGGRIGVARKLSPLVEPFGL